MRLFDLIGSARLILLVGFFVGISATMNAQTERQLTGIVYDSQGVPLIGAAVHVRGETRGTTTGLDGRYSIRATPGDHIVFSYIGYKEQAVAYQSQSVIDVTMQSDVQRVDEVVVVGYGTQRKRDVTGAIATINAKDLATTVGAANPMQALQGKVAGVDIVYNGAPGDAPQVRVRGVSSFTNSDPVYVVDGIIMDNISYLNPSDIETMQVLKDASSTAIYGSRGANGVIIITTKQGRRNQPTAVNIDASVGVGVMARYLDYANAGQYRQIQNRDVMAKNAINGTSNPLPYTDAQILAAGRGTDWQREVTRSAVTQNYNVGVTGGGERLTYSVSSGFYSQEGLIKNSGYKRASIRVSNTYDLAPWVTLGSNISYIYERRHAEPGSVLGNSLRALPTAPVYDEDGSFFGPVFSVGKVGNPVATLFYDSDNFTNYYKTLVNLFIDIKPWKNVVIHSSFTLNSLGSDGKSFLPKFQVNPEQKRTDNELAVNQARTLDWLNENTITYTLDRGKHSFSAVGGITFQLNSNQNQNQKVLGMPDVSWKNRNLWYTNLGKSSTLTGGSGGSEFTYLSYLARANYSYDGKYLITATLRVDGSSRFPSDGRYGMFPAVGVGWNMNQESWLSGLDWLDQLKLRASYGVVGSDAGIPNNIQTAYVNTVNGVFGQNPEGVITSDVLDMVIDYGLHWEEARQFNAGFDLRVLRNRLGVEFDYYIKSTKDILTSIALPGLSGTSYRPLYNIATARNSGVEFNINWRDTKGDWTYNFGLVGSTLKNRVRSVNRDLPPLEDGPNVTLVGNPIGGFWGYQTEGVYQNASQVAQSAHINGASPGDLRYKDQNDDGTIDQKDRIYLGSYLPTTTVGLSAGASYKNWELNIDFYASMGNKIYNLRRQDLGTSPYNLTTDYLHSWVGENSTNTQPRVLLDGAGTNNNFSDFFIEDGSYFKIRNLVLSYNLPKSWIKKAYMRKLNVYFSVNNLLTLTKATGYSPEVKGGPNSAGRDTFGSVYPHARTYSFGVNIGF